jgi:hypothetical protein
MGNALDRADSQIGSLEISRYPKLDSGTTIAAHDLVGAALQRFGRLARNFT